MMVTNSPSSYSANLTHGKLTKDDEVKAIREQVGEKLDEVDRQFEAQRKKLMRLLSTYPNAHLATVGADLQIHRRGLHEMKEAFVSRGWLSVTSTPLVKLTLEEMKRYKTQTLAMIKRESTRLAGDPYFLDAAFDAQITLNRTLQMTAIHIAELENDVAGASDSDRALHQELIQAIQQVVREQKQELHQQAAIAGDTLTLKVFASKIVDADLALRRTLTQELHNFHET